MMAIIGFITLLFIGALLCIVGVQIAFVEGGFTGRLSALPILFLVAGAGVLTFAFYNAPFTITFGVAP